MKKIHFILFILCRKAKYIEKIRDYIFQYNVAEIITSTYDKERLFIVNKSQ